MIFPIRTDFESVGSMVVYERGKPKRNDYRKFKIKGIQGADDYGSMREVLTRRFTAWIERTRRERRAWKVYCISGSDLDGWRKRSGKRGASGTGGPESEYSGVRHGKR